MVEIQAGSPQSNKPEVKADVPTPHFPDPNAPKTEKAAGALATVSRELDPTSHIFMAGACG